MEQTWEGKITKVYYRTNDFAIARLHTKRGDVDILGEFFGLNKGDLLRINEAQPEHHPVYGTRLRVVRWERIVPDTVQTAVEFLSSGVIKNVGPVRARTIVQALGANAVERIIAEGPECIKKVPGIGKRAEEIYVSLLSQFELQRIVQELSKYLDISVILKVYRTYGGKAADLVRQNPYILLEFIGFSKADSIAASLGLPKDFPPRLQAAVLRVMQKALEGGHCFLPLKELKKRARQAIPDITEDNLEHILVELAKRQIVKEDNRIYLSDCFQAEKDVALALARICCVTAPPPGLESAIRAYEQKNSLMLAPEQKEALRRLFQANPVILTGGPGTGKTETIKAAVAVYLRLYPHGSIGLAAPTGRSARRLTELTGREAQTIHRLLKIQPGQETVYNERNPLPYELLIIDEASMLDIFLAQSLLKAVGPQTRLLLVGDTDQLPPIGPGNVLKDLLAAELPHVRLTHIFRQATESQIVQNAHRVNGGKELIWDKAKTDFYWLNIKEKERIIDFARKSVLRLLECGYSIDEVQVLSPTKKGSAGTENLNKILQGVFFTGQKGLRHRGRVFYLGDKVIQTKNDYQKDVFNGDTGIVENIDEDAGLCVRFHDQLVAYTVAELDELDLAYAVTVHKSQGGEHRAVILLLSDEHPGMLTRNLLYTAITRAKEFFCLIGPARAVNRAIANNPDEKRNTTLSIRIIDLLEEREKEDAI